MTFEHPEADKYFFKLKFQGSAWPRLHSGYGQQTYNSWAAKKWNSQDWCKNYLEESFNNNFNDILLSCPEKRVRSI